MSSSTVRLNAEQQQAVEHFEGACLVTAVPGSGKTSTLTHRVLRLIERGVAPREILCVTFTNKAAKEMRERIIKSDPAARPVWVSTFHRLCCRILRKYGHNVGLKEAWTIYDEDDQLAVIGKVHRMWAAQTDQDADIRREEKALLANRIDELRESATPFDYATEDARLHMYVKELAAANVVDFSGMLYLTWRILSENEEVLKTLSERFKFMLVDEAQDTNDVQYAIAKLLASHGNLFMVGDFQQSIFSWRGAKPENLNTFLKDFPQATNIVLPKNYRSRAEILEIAENLIVRNSNAVDVRLINTRGSGGNVTYGSYETDRHEAWAVVDKIRRHNHEGIKWGDMAVIYRVNRYSHPFELTLAQEGIPYHTVGGPSFYNRQEIKTTLAYLKLIRNPADSESFHRAVTYPKRGVGDVLVGQIDLLAKEEGISVTEAAGKVKTRTVAAQTSLEEFLILMDRMREKLRNDSLFSVADSVTKESGYLAQLKQEAQDEKDGPKSWQRLDNLDEMLGSIAMFEEAVKNPSLDKYLQQVALVQDGENPKNKNSVALLTMHAAKGLEFPVVFVVGCVAKVLPHFKSVEEGREDEERRLFYVALTRAKDHLHVSCFEAKRYARGGTEFFDPSYFIQETMEKPLAEVTS